MTIALAFGGALGWWLLAARVTESSALQLRRIAWMLWLRLAWCGRVVENRTTGERALVTSVSRCNLSSVRQAWRSGRRGRDLLRDVFVPWEVQIFGHDDDTWHRSHGFESKAWHWKPVEGFFRRHWDAYQWCERDRGARA